MSQVKRDEAELPIPVALLFCNDGDVQLPEDLLWLNFVLVQLCRKKLFNQALLKIASSQNFTSAFLVFLFFPHY